MTVTDNPLLVGLQRTLTAPARALEAETEAQAYRIADRLSSGPYSLADLRRMGHPYARRRPRPPLPPGVINVQSGLFRRSWHVEAHLRGARMEVSIENRAPYARYLLEGTRRMIPRPYEEALRRELRAAIPRILAGALGRLLPR